VQDIAANLEGDPLIVVRSTVPVGTTQCRILPVLRAARPDLCVAFAPERTIQGQALRELVELPQVVGGVDERSLERAMQFFAQVAQQITPVSSARAAEMVKLINNCHTDLIYAFGNEVALLAETLHVDPIEAIQAANLNYPRPKLHRPGYVAGACLTKDPYLLVASAPDVKPFLILNARRLNESLPGYTAQRVLEGLRQNGIAAQNARVVVCGIAYKGTPPTDDLRGTQSIAVIAAIRAAGACVLGHDPLVSQEKIASLGAIPLDSLEAVAEAQAIVFLTDHIEYKNYPLEVLLSRLTRPAILFDAWRLFPKAQVEAQGITYQSLGV
jgi:UDP-N-acetyl-D-mannosaminuronic acid dehydrogenase